MPRTLEDNRTAIAGLFADKRPQLGEDRWNALIDELSAVRYETQQKVDALPKYPVGVLDASVAERTKLSKEEDLKWLLIRQQYGV